MGFWEEFLTRRLYLDIISSKDGKTWCHHVPPKQIAICEGTYKPKQQKNNKKLSKKEEQERIVRAEELLEATQVAHYIEHYEKRPHMDRMGSRTVALLDNIQEKKGGINIGGPLFENGAHVNLDLATEHNNELGASEVYKYTSVDGERQASVVATVVTPLEKSRPGELERLPKSEFDNAVLGMSWSFALTPKKCSPRKNRYRHKGMKIMCRPRSN